MLHLIMHCTSFGTASRCAQPLDCIKILPCASQVASRSGCALSTRLACTAPPSNLLKSHARHGLRSSKASSKIRANFMSKEKEEKHPTLAGVCPRVSGHVKSQGSRSQPSLTSRSGNPEFAASRYSWSSMHGDLSCVKRPKASCRTRRRRSNGRAG